MEFVTELNLYRDFTQDSIPPKIKEFRERITEILRHNKHPSFVFKTRFINKYPKRIGPNTTSDYMPFVKKPDVNSIVTEFAHHLINYFKPHSEEVASAALSLYSSRIDRNAFDNDETFFATQGNTILQTFIRKAQAYVKHTGIRHLLEKEQIDTEIVKNEQGEEEERPVMEYIFKSPTRGIDKFIETHYPPDEPDKEYKDFILDAYDLRNLSAGREPKIYTSIRFYVKNNNPKILSDAQKDYEIPFVLRATEGNCFINCLIDKFPKKEAKIVSIAKNYITPDGINEDLIRTFLKEFSPRDYRIIFHNRFNEEWKQIKSKEYTHKIKLYVSNNHVSRTRFEPIPFEYKPNQITYTKDVHTSFLKRSQKDNDYEVFFDSDAMAICWRDNDHIVLQDDPKINRNKYPFAMSRSSAIINEIQLEYPMYVSNHLDRFYKKPLRYMPSGLVLTREYKDLIIEQECGNIHRHDIRAAFSTPWKAKKYFVLSGVPYGTIHTCDNSIFDLNFGGLIYLTIKNPDPILNITDGWYSYSEAWYHVDHNNAIATHIIPAPREDSKQFRYILDSFRDSDSKFSLNAAIGKFQSKNKSHSAIITTKEELDLLMLSKKYTVNTIRPYQDFNDDDTYTLPYFVQYQDPTETKIGRYPHMYQEIIGATRVRLFEQKKYLESQKATIVGYRIDCIIYEHPDRIPCSNDFKHEDSNKFPMFECIGKYDQELNTFDHQGSIERIEFLNKGKLIEFSAHGGYGKTHKIKELLTLYPDNAIAIASTNAAARLLNGKTVDSFLIESTRYIPQSIIIIDEVSMCSINQHFAPLNKNLSVYCKQLFGGKTIIISGHDKQLPPVKGKSIYQHRTYKLFHKANIFTKNYRTNDDEKEFAKDLERYADSNDNSLLRNIKYIPHDEITHDATIITYSNKQKDLFNAMQFKRFAKDHPIPIVAKPKNRILTYNNKEYFNNETFFVTYDEYQTIKNNAEYVLGYAKTTHCVQGETIDHNIHIVQTDLNKASMIRKNLFYTAISRARKYSQVSFIKEIM